MPETTEDAFLGGRLTIRQMRKGSRAGVDAVFLAATCPAAPGESVLDLGSGSGVVALAIARRVDGVRATGIEIDPLLCGLAEDNAEQNTLSGRTQFMHGDVAGPIGALTAAGLTQDAFDHAVANPPFLFEGEARLPPNDRLRRAHALKNGDLERWVKCLAAFVRPGGSATMVHRADALPHLLRLFEGRFGGLTIYPLFPREGEAASRVILQGRKGSRAPLRLSRGMTLHGEGNAFTAEAQEILRHGASLDVAPAR